jgi:chromosome segregation ATPase
VRDRAKIRRENERLSHEADRAQCRKVEAEEAIEIERRELNESAERTRRELEEARDRVRREAEELAAEKARQAAELERIQEARVELKQLDAKKKEAEGEFLHTLEIPPLELNSVAVRACVRACVQNWLWSWRAERPLRTS